MIETGTTTASGGPRVPNDDLSVNDFDPPAEENIEGHPLPPPESDKGEPAVPEDDDPDVVDTEQQPT